MVVSSPARRSTDRPKSRQRSRIGNGSALLPDIDGRSTWCRRAKELVADHLADLGGEANTSTAQRSIIRRSAIITTELERLEMRFARAGQASTEDIDLYLRASNSLRRLLEAIGLKRQARDITPSLDEYLAAKQQEAAE